jgi:hypothetical protein
MIFPEVQFIKHRGKNEHSQKYIYYFFHGSE